ncbi:LPP20 family lipoprotein [Aeromonas simiae]|uniref:LPP20 family lipoprotein n=1 Tax=Aeromonas simiae TaxID=218936 RepID=UPI00266DC979|nr:LPP20 family lipoprotein [Aeromonas simiae]MDO2947202.1 LPP20 family lipoprotein [Aeromonas simiae]MDO2950814.1 LPP20 family lipoprotein [Aeromonas simiae]MDO2954204.1 LPP20 family lipoprotein [Aeromonas simiae]
MKAILSLLLLTLLAGCSNNRVTNFTNQEPDNFPVLRAVGYAVINIQPGPSQDEKMLQAIRASKMDAYRELAESLNGQQVTAHSRYKDLTQVSNALDVSVEGIVRGARVVRSYPNGNTYATEMELDTRDLYNINQMAYGY